MDKSETEIQMTITKKKQTKETKKELPEIVDMYNGLPRKN